MLLTVQFVKLKCKDFLGLYRFLLAQMLTFYKTSSISVLAS